MIRRVLDRIKAALAACFRDPDAEKYEILDGEGDVVAICWSREEAEEEVERLDNKVNQYRHRWRRVWEGE